MNFTNYLFIIIFSSPIYSQTDFKNEDSLRMRNEINERLTYVFKSNAKDSLLKDRDVYNSLGQHILDYRYNEEGDIHYHYIIEYDANGLMEKQTGYKNGKIATILTYRYDSNTNRTENFQHKPDGTLLIHQKRVYDDKNLNTELYNRDIEKNTTYLSFKYYYTDHNQYSRTERFNKKGESVSTTIYEYENNIIKLYEDKKKKKNLFLIKEYNDSNELINMIFVQSNKRIEYKYDNKGMLIEEITYVDDVIDSRKKYHYTKFSF